MSLVSNPEVFKGIVGGVFSVIVAAIAIYPKLMESRKKKKAASLEKGKDRKRVNYTPLEYHPVFSHLDELEHYFMSEFSLTDLGRTLIIREVVVHKIRIWREVLKKYSHEQ